MQYAEAVQYLYSLGNEVLTAKLGLHNISALLRFLGSPHRKFKSVLVAGTNGKGSVAAFVESVLRSSGLRTGLYTSPHLIQIEERIRVGGDMISTGDFGRLTGVMKSAVAALLDPSREDLEGGRLDRHPTYFEMVTAMALQHFAEQSVDVAVLEVGLGGRLDATNVVDPLVAIITNVDYDHQNHLGNSLEQIAFEKAGIVKPRSYQGWDPLPVVCGSQQQPLRAIVEARCRVAGARLIPPPRREDFQAEPDAFGRFRLYLKEVLGQSLSLRIPLPGEHQVSNALVAVQALRVLQASGLPITAQSVKQGIETAHWPGRLEIVEGDPLLILDGAHNPAGAQCVRKYCERFLRSRPLVMIFGAMRDKPITEIGARLFPLAEGIILTGLESPRAADPRAMAGLLPKFRHRCQLAMSAEQALEQARCRVAGNGAILIVGSLFLVGEIQRVLRSVAVVG